MAEMHLTLTPAASWICNPLKTGDVFRQTRNDKAQLTKYRLLSFF